VLGSSLFVQAHLLLGYLLGPAAREVLEQGRLPVLAAAVVLADGACPACLALGLGRARAGRNRTRRIVGPLPGG